MSATEKAAPGKQYGGNMVKNRPRVSTKEGIAAYRRVLRLVHSYMRQNLDDETLVAAGGGMLTWGELRHHIKCALGMRVRP